MERYHELRKEALENTNHKQRFRKTAEKNESKDEKTGEEAVKKDLRVTELANDSLERQRLSQLLYDSSKSTKEI